MKLSARNQLPGQVVKIAEGAVNGIVTIDVNGTPVSATISMNAIHELGLEPGKKAYAVIKATEGHQGDRSDGRKRNAPSSERAESVSGHGKGD